MVIGPSRSQRDFPLAPPPHPPTTSAETAQADLLTPLFHIQHTFVEYQPTFLEVIMVCHMKGFYLKHAYWSAIYQINPQRELRLSGRCSESGAIIINLSSEQLHLTWHSNTTIP